jgi:hypothetical protein
MDQPRRERNEFLRIEINGKRYERLEDVPAEFRRLLEDKDGNGIPDLFEVDAGTTKNTIRIERRVVDSSEMSDAQVRRLLHGGTAGADDDHHHGFGLSICVETIREHLRWLLTTLILAVIFAVIIVWTLRSYVL